MKSANPSKSRAPRRTRVCFLTGVSFAFFGMSGCFGTEADNPYAGPVDTTPCKADPKFAGGLALTSHTPTARELATPHSSLTSELTSADAEQVPLWLECIQWEVTVDSVQLLLSNFHSGCAIDWTGGAGFSESGHIVVQLDKGDECFDALCGNCLYDARATASRAGNQLTSDASGEGLTAVTLKLTDCRGETSGTSEWALPLETEPRGISCRDSDRFAAREAVNRRTFTEEQSNLHAPCSRAGDCTEERSCVNGYCAATCAEDSDCPLSGAFVCVEGACILPGN